MSDIENLKSNFSRYIIRDGQAVDKVNYYDYVLSDLVESISDNWYRDDLKITLKGSPDDVVAERIDGVWKYI